jgi:hypothetical protein
MNTQIEGFGDPYLSRIISILQSGIDPMDDVSKSPEDLVDIAVIQLRLANETCDDILISIPKYKDILESAKHKIHDALNDLTAIKMFIYAEEKAK